MGEIVVDVTVELDGGVFGGVEKPAQADIHVVIAKVAVNNTARR
jgi:hypothetical protein